MWTASGVVAFLGDVGIHRVVERWAWLEDRPWLIAGSALLLAGTCQFSDLKDRCLKECRHPGPFLMSRHRRGGGERGVVPIGIACSRSRPWSWPTRRGCPPSLAAR